MSTSEFYSHFDSMNERLQNFAYSLTNNMEAARDLYQETTYRALKYRDKFKPGTNFKAWIMTIMKNTFINGHRKKARENTMFDHTEDQYYLNSGGPSIDNLAGSNIVVDEIIGLIEQLDENLRVPFVMHFQGFKYHEIADHLDLPLGTVKSRIFFARKRLKEQILERYESVEMVMS